MFITKVTKFKNNIESFVTFVFFVVDTY